MKVTAVGVSSSYGLPNMEPDTLADATWQIPRFEVRST